ncbi:triphosphoribosyl-dephospho-CoA synthase [Paraburkholderia sp. BCC1885]|uniref:triphosphoribosyl-dephospho-CoA synthase n=1 Tax=Paraburkholderia sp. BCC1885 TaxID=2562669 RepID=UPI001181E6C1|nr:triphosphoribosyl-dephospho-CoA synthase [Paraburkholderia sp. BCC1885]
MDFGIHGQEPMTGPHASGYGGFPDTANATRSRRSHKEAGVDLACRLADAAVKALLDEAELTPKPALVDRRGRGAHVDLDLSVMRRSAHSLRPGFTAMAHAAASSLPKRHLRETLGRIGRETEQTMLAVTDGSNAHRGAIWVIGLLVAGTARARERSADVIAAEAAAIARHRDRFVPAVVSNGQHVSRRYGVRGARGEAEDGFPHVVSVALPALRAARGEGRSEDAARLDALLSIMALLDDTCLLHRGGIEALSVAKRGASEVMAAGGSGTSAGLRRLAALDADLLTHNASPGGAADLLAAALFLDHIERDDRLSIPVQPRSR